MLKKMINCLAIGLIICTSILWFLSSKRQYDSSFTAIAVATNYSYLYHDKGSFTIPVFINDKHNILKYVDSNSFSIGSFDESTMLSLAASSSEISQKTNYNNQSFYCYEITLSLPDIKGDLAIPKCYLTISNEVYTLKLQIGSFFMRYSPDIHYFNYYSLYASYGFYDEIKNIAAVNVGITNKNSTYTITKLKSGIALEANFSGVQINSNFSNELTQEEMDEYVLAKSPNMNNLRVYDGNAVYFIPLKNKTEYYSASFYLELTIDNQPFFIDNFCYKNGQPDLNDYDSLCKRGEITNVSV